ncbi:hypothetical protein H0H93_011716 [Arthromyces matolae]|nr:hypothetical protein H0H93_011716 [Arthromyces matolae]
MAIHDLKNPQTAFTSPSIHFCGPHHHMAQPYNMLGESAPSVVPPQDNSSTPPLEEVPREYFIQSLRALAPNYWNKHETSDCTIIVPIPQLPGGPLPSIFNGPVSPDYYPLLSSSSNRRDSEPNMNITPQLRFQLHIDYLSTHSSYMRALLSGANPLDLVHTTMDTYVGPRTDRRYSVPANRMPRLLPSPSNHPALFLPVPDPSSFFLVLHWIYFGDTSFIAESLRRKSVHWEGLARNVEYLGISAELKVFLQGWYYGETDENGSETACSDDDSDVEMDICDSSTITGDDSDDEKDPARGRPRIRRPLSYQEPGTKPWYD